MPKIKITYFKTMDIDSAGRVLDMIGHDIPHLVQNAAKLMAFDEHFACFTAPDGQEALFESNSFRESLCLPFFKIKRADGISRRTTQKGKCHRPHLKPKFCQTSPI